MNKPNIVVISDYGNGDPSFTEVSLQLKKLNPEATIFPQSVPPFSTINTGFWIYQIAMTPGLKDTFIFSNTAPRKETKEAEKNNHGEKLMYARLKNGFELLAINARYAFSFIKPEIESLHIANCSNEGSQFRSRDIYPSVVAKMVKNDNSFAGERVDPSLIPDYPRNAVASIDGYGNVKTTLRESEVQFEVGQKILITMNGKRHHATYSKGSFDVIEGGLAFSPGSTGHDDRFMEIFFRGSSAASLFGGTTVEETFTVEAS